MKEILAQKNNNGAWMPYSLADADISAEFKDNQICRIQIYGVQKQRSAPQLRMFWACCNKVVENTDDQYWNTREKVADQIKIALNFVDLDRTIMDPKGNIHFHYKSIAYKNLGHMEACKFFDRAWPVMSEKIGISVDELLLNCRDYA